MQNNRKEGQFIIISGGSIPIPLTLRKTIGIENQLPNVAIFWRPFVNPQLVLRSTILSLYNSPQ